MSLSLFPVRLHPTPALRSGTPATHPYNQLCSRPVMLRSSSLAPDDTFADLADGKLDGQKAFMTGKLKTKGNMMLATKLGPILATAKPKAKL